MLQKFYDIFLAVLAFRMKTLLTIPNANLPSLLNNKYLNEYKQIYFFPIFDIRPACIPEDTVLRSEILQMY